LELYCPKCRHEYRGEYDVCVDCNVDLVSELPPDIPEEYIDADWVEVHTFPGTLYARMAVELLIHEEIPAYSISQFGGAALGVSGSSDFVGSGATVYVLEPDLDQALRVIEPMIAELPGAYDEDYPPDYEE